MAIIVHELWFFCWISSDIFFRFVRICGDIFYNLCMWRYFDRYKNIVSVIFSQAAEPIPSQAVLQDVHYCMVLLRHTF